MTDSTHNNFTPIQNPFIVGNPIKDENMFFGREDDFAYTKSKIIGGKRGGLLVLCGARRSGKTSILFQIKAGRLGEEFIPVLIDMQSMTVQSDGDFLSKLAREIIQTLDTSAIKYTEDFLESARTDPFAAFEGLIQKINTHLDGRKLVLMFDEYEIIESLINNEAITQNILHILANWMEHKEGVFIIFTGSDRLQARDPKCWERFLGRALYRRISFLSKGDTLRLVNEPVAGQVHYDAAVPNLIYDLTAGQPFYTQVLCQSIIDHLNEDRKNSVNQGDIGQVVQEIIENPLPQMIFAWNSLNSMEKMSLSIIAELTKDGERKKQAADIIAFPDRETIGYSLDSNKVNESLERLFHYDLLDKEEESGAYIFKMDLWRQWITRMHSIWQVIDEIQSEESGLGEGIVPVRKGTSKPRLIAITAIASLAVIFTLVYIFVLREEAGPGTGISRMIPPDSTTLTITTIPPGATIYLDERRLGSSPLIGRPVVASTAVLRIEIEGYKNIEDTLFLEKDQPLERTFDLAELTGSLRVTSDPDGADIILNGISTGFKTPHTFPGLSVNATHSVKLTRRGFNPGSSSGITIRADDTEQYHHRFSTRKHQLRVDSEPPGASVLIDGRAYDLTPCLIPQLSEETHTLTITLGGYLEHRQQITIPQPNDQIRIVLQPAPPGRALLIVVPFADIYVNGVLVKRSAPNHTLSGTPGEYRIRLEHPNFGTIEDVITIKSNQEITREYDMQKGARQ